MPADMSHAASNIWIWIFMLVVPAIALVLSILLSRRGRARYEDEAEERLMRQAPPPHLDSPENPRAGDERKSA